MIGRANFSQGSSLGRMLSFLYRRMSAPESVVFAVGRFRLRGASGVSGRSTLAGGSVSEDG